MAIFNVLKYEGDNKTFIYRHPKTNFNTGSQLIVHESQEAIFMQDGKALDSFGPGRHTLETENLPIIKTLQKLVTGGKSAFHAELYFVNLTEQMAIRWGTDSKIQYLDPVYNFPLEIGASGYMSLAVNNPRKLLVKIVGTEKTLTQDQVVKYFRSFLITRIKSIVPMLITQNRWSIFALDEQLGVLSDEVKEKVQDDLYDYGINLPSFKIAVIVKPEEDRNYIRFKELHYRQYTDVAEAELQQRLDLIKQQTKAQQTVMEAEAIAKKRSLEGYTYQQEHGFDVAKIMAENEATGQFNNLGIGLGLMAGIGGTLGKQVGNMASSAVVTAAEPVKTKRFCMNCGHEISPGALFCEKCGTRVPAEDSCSNCGYVFTNDAAFCPKCGKKRGE